MKNFFEINRALVAKKKIFAFVAIACMAFGLASCSDESSAGGREVSNKEFKLVVSAIQENNVVLSVYPTDENQTYYLNIWTVKDFKKCNIDEIAQIAIENEDLTRGSYEDVEWELLGNTDYVLLAFYLDENGAISEKMTTLYFTTGHITPEETVEFKYEGLFLDYTQEPDVYEYEGVTYYDYYWEIDVYNNDMHDDLDLYFVVDQDSPMSGTYDAWDLWDGGMYYYDKEKQKWSGYGFAEAKVKVSRHGKKATAKGYVIDAKGIRYNVDVKATLYEDNDEAPARRLPAHKLPARKPAPKLGIRAQMK